MRQRHAEIAGAGFAGITAAISLRQRGWTVRVHEAAPELRNFGAGIFVWDNGLRVLRALGAYEEATAGAHEAPGYEGRNAEDERVSLVRVAVEKRTRMLTMTRQQLYSAMLSAAERAGVDFQVKSEVVEASPDGSLTTAKGRNYRADLVVGADGVASKVRDSLGFVATRKKYDVGIIRLLVERGPNDLQRTDPDNVINFWHPRLRVLYVPCSRNALYLALAAHEKDEEATRIPVNREVWSEAFPHLSHIFARLGDQGRYDTYETTVLDRWSRGRAVLVGDSAHPMPPTLGQGAGCAMMNALSLGVAVEGPHGDDIVSALCRWEESERPLTDHTQRISSLYAENRTGSDGGDKWTREAMRAAHHIPVGAEE